MKFKLSGAFGEIAQIRNNVPHSGIDIATPMNTELRSVINGTVEAIRDYGTQNIGKGVIIRGDDGNFYIYGHLNRILVEKGQNIGFGETLGLSGSTGNSSAPHLHFGIQDGTTGEFLDPTNYAELLSAMSGEINPAELLALSDGAPGFLDGIKNFFSNGQVDQYREGPDLFWQWAGDKVGEFLIFVWDWFIFNLPDIMGYITILAAIAFILSSMLSGKGMIKTLSIYAGLLILSLIILGSV